MNSGLYALPAPVRFHFGAQKFSKFGKRLSMKERDLNSAHCDEQRSSRSISTSFSVDVSSVIILSEDDSEIEFSNSIIHDKNTNEISTETEVCICVQIYVYIFKISLIIHEEKTKKITTETEVLYVIKFHLNLHRTSIFTAF